jgi:hypothetical protein
MHRSLRRTISLVIPVLSVAALLAVVSSSASIAATTSSSTTPKLAGIWTGSYSGAYSGHFTLHWRQTASGKLKGSIALSNPPGTYGITGSVRGSAISFGVVGAGATYTGSVSGKSMSGRYKTATGGGRWSAHKSS